VGTMHVADGDDALGCSQVTYTPRA
jgi:hypothetical protein